MLRFSDPKSRESRKRGGGEEEEVSRLASDWMKGAELVQNRTRRVGCGSVAWRVAAEIYRLSLRAGGSEYGMRGAIRSSEGERRVESSLATRRDALGPLFAPSEKS